MPPGLSVIRILTTDSINRDPWSSRARHCLGRIMVGQPVGLCLMLLFANRSSTLFAKRCSSVFNRLSIETNLHNQVMANVFTSEHSRPWKAARVDLPRAVGQTVSLSGGNTFHNQVETVFTFQSDMPIAAEKPATTASRESICSTRDINKPCVLFSLRKFVIRGAN